MARLALLLVRQQSTQLRNTVLTTPSLAAAESMIRAVQFITLIQKKDAPRKLA